jgi:X-X-X-Leu-X-X-Gly heptad repeat protein
MGADQKACADDSTSSACDELADDSSAVSAAMKDLGTSVYTTSGYLNGAVVKGKKMPGLASGLSQVASGAHQLADGATMAADKGSAIPTGAAAAADGSRKLSKIQKIIDKAVHKALPKAYEKALKQVAFERNLSVKDGKLAVNWADPVQRWAMVDTLTPTLVDAIKTGDTGDTNVKTDNSTSDTSFLTGADPRLTKPFMVGFNDSVVTIYWVALAVMLVAFVITLFYKVPPLRTRSALQEKSDLREAMLEGGAA